MGALKAVIEASLGVPAGEVTLSADPALLTSKGLEEGVDLLAPDKAVLADLGVKHGDLVGGERGGGAAASVLARAGRSVTPPPPDLISSTCSSLSHVTSRPRSSAMIGSLAPR